MAGIFGSNRKKEYTVYGRTVNLAARLERLARADEILICQDTFQDVKDRVRTKKVCRLNVRGMERAIPIYRVIERL